MYLFLKKTKKSYETVSNQGGKDHIPFKVMKKKSNLFLKIQ